LSWLNYTFATNVGVPRILIQGNDKGLCHFNLRVFLRLRYNNCDYIQINPNHYALLSFIDSNNSPKYQFGVGFNGIWNSHTLTWTASLQGDWRVQYAKDYNETCEFIICNENPFPTPSSTATSEYYGCSLFVQCEPYKSFSSITALF